MPRKPETAFRHDKVIPFLKELGVYYDTIQQVGKKGSPDIYCCIGGRFVALELKSKDGDTSKLQDRRLNWILADGGYAFVPKPGNWESVKAELRRLKAKGRIHD